MKAFYAPFCALLLAAAPALALAEVQFTNVPDPLQKPLQGNGLKSAQMNQGVLRLQMDKPQISELVYSSFIYHSICAEQWRRPQVFSSLGLAKVELLGTQGEGYAFDARGDVCEQMGRLGQNYRQLITQHTSTCQAGNCAGK